MFAFDLNAEIRNLQGQIPSEAGRIAKTLVKYPDFRLVLTAMKAGSRMEEHQTPTRISVQTVLGRLRMKALEKVFDLPMGHILVLDRDVPHDVEALEDSAFLLTFAWPEKSE